MQTHELNIDGKKVSVNFEEDIPWGEFQTILKDSLGGGSLDFNVFSDKLMRLCVTSDGFDFKNPTNVKKLGALEMTAIVGKMLDILPLEIYLNNLGVGKGGKLDNLIDQTRS